MKTCRPKPIRTRLNIIIVTLVIVIIAVNAVFLSSAPQEEELYEQPYQEEPQSEPSTYHTNRTEDSNMYQNRQITSSEAYALMQKNPDAIILDVRTRQEFSTGRIPGAVLLPDYQIQEYAQSIIPYKDSLVLVYCRSGARSRTATSILVSMGFTNVYDFGGIASWPYSVER